MAGRSDQGCASPPCLLGEIEAGPAPAPAGDDWAEIRLWRRAKRQVLTARRLAMPADRRAAHGAAITAALDTVLRARRPALLGCYWPFKGEYDPRPLMRSLHAAGLPLALPVVVEPKRPVIFRPWSPGVAMHPGIWDIPVPADGPAVLPDMLLVPLLGFDGSRFRLGYGGGYYDRTLAAATPRPRTIGVGFELSRLPTIHPQPHDIGMDRIVTERGVT